MHVGLAVHEYDWLQPSLNFGGPSPAFHFKPHRSLVVHRQVVGALARHGDVPDLVDHALVFLVSMSADPAMLPPPLLAHLEVRHLVTVALTRHGKNASIASQAAVLLERLPLV